MTVALGKAYINMTILQLSITNIKVYCKIALPAKYVVRNVHLNESCMWGADDVVKGLGFMCDSKLKSTIVSAIQIAHMRKSRI